MLISQWHYIKYINFQGKMINEDIIQHNLSPLMKFNAIRKETRAPIIIQIQSSCDQQIVNAQNSYTTSLSSKITQNLIHRISSHNYRSQQNQMSQQFSFEPILKKTCHFVQRGHPSLKNNYEVSMQERTVQSENDCQGPKTVKEPLKQVQNMKMKDVGSKTQQQVSSKLIGYYLLKIAKDIQQKNKASKQIKLLSIQQPFSQNAHESQSKAQMSNQPTTSEQKKRKRLKKLKPYLQLSESEQDISQVGFYRYKIPHVVDMLRKLSQKTKNDRMRYITKKAMIPPRPSVEINSAKHRYLVKTLKLQLQSRKIICLD